MASKSDPTRTTNWQERRRGVRLNSRVRVTLEWEDSSGKVLREQGFTRVVNPCGCLLLLPVDLPLELKVRITNLANDEVTPGTVVWKGNATPEGHELGVEFERSPDDFWGLQL